MRTIKSASKWPANAGKWKTLRYESKITTCLVLRILQIVKNFINCSEIKQQILGKAMSAFENVTVTSKVRQIFKN